MSRTVLLLAVLCACTISEDNAPDALASAYCGKARSCERGEFDATWDSRADCEDDVAAGVEAIQDFYDLLNCEYLPREAARARSDIRSQSCEEFVNDNLNNTELYDCDG